MILAESLPGGSAAPVQPGDTATHEVGHWLEPLPHLPGRLQAARATRSPTPRPRRRPPSAARSAATPARTKPGLDPIHNFMDYTDDACMFEFTGGQATRMLNGWNAYRA